MKSSIDKMSKGSKTCAWSKVCSLKAGAGKLVLFEPDSIEELLECRQETSGNIFILGNGSNIVGSDATEPSFALRLGKNGCFGEVRNLDGGFFRVGCACNLPQLLLRLAQQGYGGLSALSGIPGTLGGILAMNAGANGEEISVFVHAIEGFDLCSGDFWHWQRVDGGWSYRQSPIPRSVVALQAVLELRRVAVDDEKNLLAMEHQRRQKSTPKGASAGCVFRNPSSAQPAGRLLEMAACKELSSGVFSVSQQHANWIVNLSYKSGNARDCRILTQLMQERVREKFNIELECEWRWIE